jgi:RNA-dependent RNA polymerase
VLDDVFRLDRKIQDGWTSPSWKKISGGNESTPTRHPSLGEFIIDRLEDEAKVVKETKGAELDKLLPQYPLPRVDIDLTVPWLEEWKKTEEESNKEKAFITSLEKEFSRMRLELHVATQLFNNYGEGLASRRLADLKAIKKHVEALRIGYHDASVKQKMTNLDWQDKLRALSKQFSSTPILGLSSYSDTEISRLSASYAYLYDAQNGTFSQFPWVMAMRELNSIKCRGLGSSSTVTGQFNNHSFLKLWS